MCKYLLIVIGLLSTLSGFGQTYSTWDANWKKGNTLANGGNWTESIPYYKTAYEKGLSRYGPSNWRCGYAAYRLVWAYDYTKQYDDEEEAIKLWKKYYAAQYAPDTNDVKFHGTVLTRHGVIYKERKNREKQVEHFEAAVEFLKQHDRRVSIDYHVAVSNLATIYSISGLYRKELYYANEWKYCVGKLYGKSNEHYTYALSYVASASKRLGNYQEALKANKEALAVSALLDGKMSSTYVLMLSNLGVSYLDLQMYDSAIIVLRRGNQIAQANHFTNTSDYSTLTGNLGMAYKKTAAYDSALYYYTLNQDLILKLKGKYSSSYYINLTNLSGLYAAKGNYRKAISLEEESLKMVRLVSGKNHPSYATRLSNLGVYNSSLGNHAKAVQLYQEAIQIDTQMNGKLHISLARKYNNLGNAYSNLDKPQEAIQYLSEAYNIYARLGNQSSSEAATILSNTALQYADLGMFDEAIKTQQRALDIVKIKKGSNHPDYGRNLNNMASIYLDAGRPMFAVTFSKQALQNAAENFGKNDLRYSNRLSGLAALYGKLGKNEEAVDLLEESLKICAKTAGKRSSNYSVQLNNMAESLFELGRYKEANKYYQEALEVTGQVYGEDHSQYAAVLNNIGVNDLAKADYRSAEQHFMQANTIVLDEMRDVFYFQSELNQKKFIESITYYFEIYQSAMAEMPDPSDGFVEMNLNNAITLKGLLVRKNANIVQELETSYNATVREQVNRYRELKQRVSSSASGMLGYSGGRDSLQLELSKQEEALIKKYYSIHGNQERFKNKTWNDIAESIGDSSIMLEFVSYETYSNAHWTHKDQYGCFVIRPNSKPQYIPLFQESEINSIVKKGNPTRLYSTRGGRTKSTHKLDHHTADSLYNLIWDPIDSMVQSSSKVYIAASGILHRMAFGALSKDGIPLCQTYDLVQLTSSANVSHTMTQPKLNSITMVGGVNYDLNTTHSGPWSYLPGTQSEIDAIGEICNANEVSTKTISGEDATEQVVKRRMNYAKGVLHLSTHGYFYADPASDRSSSNKNVFARSKDPMVRSGLLFAGANENWNSFKPQLSSNDGVMTAMEVSNLNLSKVDLVVLSACETGLGDIDGNEGVYGLQRAFKQAGAKIIIMSLWEVPDKETQEFMQEFYKRWASGIDLRHAFRETQRFMQHAYANEPEKWAAFVLLE